jgi:hypothetical protein
MNQRLVLLMRRCMSAYARRWRVIRRDPIERGLADYYLACAIQCRERARQWEANPI